VLEVIECARQVTQREIQARIEAPRAGDPARLVADASRIQTVLGWKPAVSDLRAIVQSAWTWRQHHPKGYGR
jgi:UDP-glucose 4-epimerase